MKAPFEGPVPIPNQDWLRDQSIAFIDTTNSIGATIIGSVSRDLLAVRYAKFLFNQSEIIHTKEWLYEQTAAFIESLLSPEFNRADILRLSFVTRSWADHIYSKAYQRDKGLEAFRAARRPT